MSQQLKVTNIRISPVLCSNIEQAIQVLHNAGYAITNKRYHLYDVTNPQGSTTEMRRSGVINPANHNLPAIEHRTEPGTEFAPFPELSNDENELIQRAHNTGFCLFFPAVPNATAQARNTYNAAREYISAQTTANKKPYKQPKGRLPHDKPNTSRQR